MRYTGQAQVWADERPAPECKTSRDLYPAPRRCALPWPFDDEPQPMRCHLGHPANCRQWRDMVLDMLDERDDAK